MDKLHTDWVRIATAAHIIHFLHKKKKKHFRNPTPNTATPIWPVATGFPLDYMQIGNQNGKFDSQILQPRVGYFSSRSNFWKELRDLHDLSSWRESSSGRSTTSGRLLLSLAAIFMMCFNFL